MSSFFIQKSYKQLFCSYGLGMYFIGARKLAQKLRVKCWGNWPLDVEHAYGRVQVHLRNNHNLVTYDEGDLNMFEEMCLIKNMLVCKIMYQLQHIFYWLSLKEGFFINWDYVKVFGRTIWSLFNQKLCLQCGSKSVTVNEISTVAITCLCLSRQQ